MKGTSYRGNRVATNRGRRRGFTLIETAVATAIVGLGVAAVMVATGSGTRMNDAGKKLTEAAFLAQELREWTIGLPFSDPNEADQGNPPGPDGSNPQVFVDDLDDLMGVTYSPPRNARGTAITDMSDWSQHIELTWRDPDNLVSVVAAGLTDVIHVEVSLSCRGTEVMKTGWLVTQKE